MRDDAVVTYSSLMPHPSSLITFMPLEIRELVIKSTVVPESGGNQEAGGSGGGGNASPDNEVFVNQIVEKVLEVLRQKEER